MYCSISRYLASLDNNTISRIPLLFVALSCLHFSVLPVAAGAPPHGARAAGMGTAFVGVADDASAIFHNPAGITQLEGSNVYSGVTAIIGATSYQNLSGQKEETDFQVFFPGHLFYVSNIKESDLFIGLGLYSPFGIGGRKWAEDGLSRYFSTESYIATFSANPTLAWQATPALSLAVGVDYLYSENFAERKQDQSFFAAADGTMELEAKGDGWGYNLGLLYQATPSLRLGLAYRSQIEVKYKGDAKIRDIAPALQPVFGGPTFSTELKTAAQFPETISIGIAYAYNDRWLLAADLEYVRWSSFDEQDFDFVQEVPAAGFTDNTLILDWEDTLQFKAGVEYQASEDFRLRSGYAYIPTSVPDRTVNPANPEADQHNFSIGMGYAKGSLCIDLFYGLGIYEKRQVQNAFLAGSYRNMMHALGISLNYSF